MLDRAVIASQTGLTTGFALSKPDDASTVNLPTLQQTESTKLNRQHGEAAIL